MRVQFRETVKANALVGLSVNRQASAPPRTQRYATMTVCVIPRNPPSARPEILPWSTLGASCFSAALRAGIFGARIFGARSTVRERGKAPFVVGEPGRQARERLFRRLTA